MRPRFRSYGLSSTATRSPGSIRMKFLRILPETCANTSWLVSSFTLNMALGNVSTTVAMTSIASSFDKQCALLPDLHPAGNQTKLRIPRPDGFVSSPTDSGAPGLDFETREITNPRGHGTSFSLLAFSFSRIKTPRFSTKGQKLDAGSYKLFRQNSCPGRGHRHRVLEMSTHASVAGHCRPAVAEHPDIRTAGVHHRLDCNHHAGAQFHTMA